MRLLHDEDRTSGRGPRTRSGRPAAGDHRRHPAAGRPTGRTGAGRALRGVPGAGARGYPGAGRRGLRPLRDATPHGRTPSHPDGRPGTLRAARGPGGLRSRARRVTRDAGGSGRGGGTPRPRRRRDRGGGRRDDHRHQQPSARPHHGHGGQQPADRGTGAGRRPTALDDPAQRGVAPTPAGTPRVVRGDRLRRPGPRPRARPRPCADQLPLHGAASVRGHRGQGGPGDAEDLEDAEA